MRPHPLHSIALLLAALSLPACGIGEPEASDEPTHTSTWCEEDNCEEEDSPNNTTPAEPGDEQTTPVPTDMPSPQMANNTSPEEPDNDQSSRPAMIPMPAPFTEEVYELALHERYGCAIIGDQVTCWGDNTWGQAQPPEDVWGDRLALGPDYACVASGPAGIDCWGDGAWRVEGALEEHIILGRHTLTGFGAASTGLLCYNTGYGSDFGQLACGDGESHWLIGEENTFGVSVTYEHETRREPFICWIEHEGQINEWSTRYSYWCSVDGQTIELPAPPDVRSSGDRPQIMHDGIDTVTVVDDEGVPHWYRLEYSEPCRGAAPFPYFTRMEVDTSGHFFPERPGGTTLLTPNCVQKQTQIICRDSENTLEVMRPTLATRSAGYENTLEFQLCLVEVVSESKVGKTSEIKCERFDRR